MAAHSFNLLPGVTGVHLDVEVTRTSTDHIARCLEILFRARRSDRQRHHPGGLGRLSAPGNRMNLIQIHRAGDLAESLNWQLPIASTG